MNMLIKPAIISVFLAIAFSTTALAQISTRRDQAWKPVEVNGARVVDANAYMEIEPGQRQFTGNTGCNLMRGTLVVGPHNRIDIQSTITTKRACKLVDGSVPERTFLKALNDAVRYRRHSQTLDLFNKRGQRVIRFASILKERPNGNTASAGSLEDRKWFLESIAGRETLVAIKGVFVNFMAEKGTAGGDTGCNVFGGSYTAGKRNIAITDIISTMRACEEDGKMQLEREFLDGLRNATRYEIKDNHLRLYRKNELLLTLRGEPKG
jgi:heat shock protein HslJ